MAEGRLPAVAGDVGWMPRDLARGGSRDNRELLKQPWIVSVQ